MTDRYTELVKQAYEAQQAREGEGYVKLTTELAVIDTQLEALAASRETTVAALEAMDDAVEAAKEALDAYFAGRDEDAAEPTESDDALFEPEYSGNMTRYFQEIADSKLHMPTAAEQAAYEAQRHAIEPIPSEEDEYATAKLAGALS